VAGPGHPVGEQPIEVILMRQLASYLAMPIFLVDPAGTLLFYNEPAEAILGSRYEETGPLTQDEWGTAFRPTDQDGAPLSAERLPLSQALAHHRPAHAVFSILGLDGVTRRVAATAIPVEGQGGRFLGAVALFWEEP
jgi:PAS domain-containing protein